MSTLASLGTLAVCLIFGALFLITLAAFLFKTRRPKVMERLLVR